MEKWPLQWQKLILVKQINSGIAKVIWLCKLEKETTDNARKTFKENN